MYNLEDLKNDSRYQQMRAYEVDKFARSGAPYVELIAVRNKGTPQEVVDPLFVNLDSTNGTLANINGLEAKGFLVVGCGNISAVNVPGVTRSEMGDEHLRIKQHVETGVANRRMGYEQARREMEALRAREAVEAPATEKPAPKETIQDKALKAQERLAREKAAKESA